MEWLWIGIAAIVGILLGATVVYLVMRGRDERETVARLQREMEEYRGQVTEHFVQTADLVNNLTSSYKAVYDHLEQGAYRLVNEETLRERLANVEAAPVQLEYIGKRDARAVLGAPAPVTAATTGEVRAQTRHSSTDEDTDTWGATEGGPTASWVDGRRPQEPLPAAAGVDAEAQDASREPLVGRNRAEVTAAADEASASEEAAVAESVEADGDAERHSAIFDSEGESGSESQAESRSESTAERIDEPVADPESDPEAVSETAAEAERAISGANETNETNEVEPIETEKLLGRS